MFKEDAVKRSQHLFQLCFYSFPCSGDQKIDVCDLWRALHPHCQGLGVLQGCLLEAGVTQIHLKKVCTGSKHAGVAPNRRYADKHARALIGLDTSVWQQLKTWVRLCTLVCVCECVPADKDPLQDAFAPAFNASPTDTETSPMSSIHLKITLVQPL